MARFEIITDAKTGAVTMRQYSPAEEAAADAAAAEAGRLAALAELAAIDAASIRAMREYIAGKPDAPQVLKDRETTAQAARGKLA